jgi:hypothetical protein
MKKSYFKYTIEQENMIYNYIKTKQQDNSNQPVCISLLEFSKDTNIEKEVVWAIVEDLCEQGYIGYNLIPPIGIKNYYIKKEGTING